MKKLLLSIFAIFFGSSSAPAQSLVEFSTSMDFKEFEVVLKHLNAIDSDLAGEMKVKIGSFKNSTVPGQSQQINFDGFAGYMVLEREDDYAFGIATFTTEEINFRIDMAYELGTKELGI